MDVRLLLCAQDHFKRPEAFTRWRGGVLNYTCTTTSILQWAFGWHMYNLQTNVVIEERAKFTNIKWRNLFHDVPYYKYCLKLNNVMGNVWLVGMFAEWLSWQSGVGLHWKSHWRLGWFLSLATYVGMRSYMRYTRHVNFSCWQMACGVCPLFVKVVNTAHVEYDAPKEQCHWQCGVNITLQERYPRCKKGDWELWIIPPRPF